MEILGLILLACGLVPFAGTHFLMYCRRRDFHDPAGWEAYRAGRQMGQICFALLLVVSLGIWGWCGYHIVNYKPSGGWIDLGPILYRAACLVPPVGLAGNCLAWLWTPDRPSRPQPNDQGFSRY